jgi:hypothetical protein
MFTPNAHKDGTVELKHYMGILQKTASLVQNALMRRYVEKTFTIKIRKDYNWKEDPEKYKPIVKANHGLGFYNWLKKYNILDADKGLPAEYTSLISNNIHILADPKKTKVILNVNAETGVWTITDPSVTTAASGKSLEQTIKDKRQKDFDDKYRAKVALFNKFNASRTFNPSKRTFKNPAKSSSSSSESPSSSLMERILAEQEAFIKARKEEQRRKAIAKRESMIGTSLTESVSPLITRAPSSPYLLKESSLLPSSKSPLSGSSKKGGSKTKRKRTSGMDMDLPESEWSEGEAGEEEEEGEGEGEGSDAPTEEIPESSL